MSNRERGEYFVSLVGDYLARQGISLKPEYFVQVGLNIQRKKRHRFDLGNDSILVECKYYDWTEGGNKPSAKISTLNEAMLYFLGAPTSYRKMLFVPDTQRTGKHKETLAEYYMRLHSHFIPDSVEIWEFIVNEQRARRV
ncbi:MAG: hypothetical protein U0175_26465 [Caldilineaceae bacterium]